jgi:CoA-dependent NAD(P)H sulfur oxidoreductase
MAERVLIVGGVAAGTKAAATVRRRNPDLDVVLIQEESDVSYAGCGLPYHLADPGVIERSDLIARSANSFRESGIDLRCEHRVLGIDVKSRRARVRDLKSKKEQDEPFDRLLLATGAMPIVPAFEGAQDGPKVIALRSIADADKIVKLLPDSKNVVIIGGGYIGLEMAETFHRLKRNVCVVEKLPRLMPDFPPEFSDLVVEALSSAGVSLRLGVGVMRLNKSGVVLEDESTIEADLVLVAIGVKPRVDLATDAGISIGATGAIKTSARMETNVPGIYAAGDCAEAIHIISKAPVWIPLGDTANRQGRVAGVNMAGGDAVFPGILGSAVFSTFGIGVARSGLTKDEAEKAGIEAVSCVITHQSRAKYMPESCPLHVSLVAEKGSGRLLGGQAVGADAADKTIATLSAALWGGLSVEDLSDMDLPYAPPFSPVFEPAQIAAEVLRKKTNKQT